MAESWLPSGPNITVGDPVDPPPGWIDLLRRRPDLSSLASRPERVAMTAAKFMRLSQVQVGVNQRVRYVRDHGDDWRVADLPSPAEASFAKAGTEGDCEDYALAKMVRLLDYGWPRGALRITLCYVVLSDSWQAHAVLMVETDHGTWVLDNRMKYPRLWTRMIDYRWLWRDRPGGETWERLLNTDQPALAPVEAGGHE